MADGGWFSWLASFINGGATDAAGAVGGASGVAGAVGGASGVAALVKQAQNAQRIKAIEVDVAALQAKDEKHDRQFRRIEGVLGRLDERSMSAARDQREILARIRGEWSDEREPDRGAFPEEPTEV